MISVMSTHTPNHKDRFGFDPEEGPFLFESQPISGMVLMPRNQLKKATPLIGRHEIMVWTSWEKVGHVGMKVVQPTPGQQLREAAIFAAFVARRAQQWVLLKTQGHTHRVPPDPEYLSALVNAPPSDAKLPVLSESEIDGLHSWFEQLDGLSRPLSPESILAIGTVAKGVLLRHFAAEYGDPD